MRIKNPVGSSRVGTTEHDVILKKVRYLLLEAERISEPDLALDLYQEALAACNSVASPAGPNAAPANQPLLMDVVFGVAESYWRLNRLDDAAVHFRDLIQRDPSDARLARYWLAACLFGLQLYEELDDLLAHFGDQSHCWLYARALHEFATEGDTEKARKLLIDAHGKGRKFMDYLFGDEQVLASRLIRMRSDSSLHGFARLYLPAWRSVPGAVAWTRQALRIPLSDRSVTPMPLPLNQLLELPRSKATWRVGVSPAKKTSSENTYWIVAVVCDETVLSTDIVDLQPTPAVVWSAVLKAMLEPISGSPSVPSVIEVARPEYSRAWQRMLNEVDCQCRLNYRMPMIQEFFKELATVVEATRLRQLDADFEPLDLPQTDAVWQIGFFHQPEPISNAKVGVVRPWLLCILDRDSKVALCCELSMEQPGREAIWEYARRLMQKMSIRPQRLELMNGDGFGIAKEGASKCATDCVLRDELPELDNFLFEMAVSFSSPEKCSLVNGRGVTPEVMEEFYEVAAIYYSRAPWRHVPGDVPIEIRLANGETRYAVVMGRSGMTFGVTVYEDFGKVRDLLCGRTREMPESKSVIFDEFMSLSPQDLYLVERHGWPIATPEAYPVAMSLSRDRQPDSPSKVSLKLLIGIMRVLPDFVESEMQSKSYDAESYGFKQAVQCTWTAPRSQW